MAIRIGGLATMVMAVVLAAAGFGISGWSRPEPAVIVATGAPTLVEWVLPGGPTWRDGVRPGQTVVQLSGGMDPNTWALVTSDGERLFTTSYSAQEAELREELPIAALAVLLAVVAWLSVRRLALAVGVAGLSLLLVSYAIAPSGNAVVSSVAAITALAAPVLWLTGWGIRSPRARAAVLLVAGAVALSWLAARYGPDPWWFDVAEVNRQGVSLAGLGAVAVLLTDWRRWRVHLLSIESGRIADLVVLVAVIALVVFVAILIEAPLILLIAIGVGAIFLYPRLRRRMASAIDQLLVGDIRDRASLEAVEEERGRIARDLHDAPLQEISTVIRQLDRRTDASHETELLRNAASHLRRVTAELRPPVLDDLGLRAAIAFVIDQAAANERGVEVAGSIEPDELFAERPPSDVELAVFRIVQEAVTNALEHADASRVEITARVTSKSVRAAVEDNGRGIGEGVAREAMRAGHLGITSMSQRAAAIDASLHIGPGRSSGTKVTVEWRGRS